MKNKTFGFALSFSRCWLTATSWVTQRAHTHIVCWYLLKVATILFIPTFFFSNILYGSILCEFCSVIFLKIAHLFLSLTYAKNFKNEIKENIRYTIYIIPVAAYIIVYDPPFFWWSRTCLKGQRTDCRNSFKVKFWCFRFFSSLFICPLIHC